MNTKALICEAASKTKRIRLAIFQWSSALWAQASKKELLKPARMPRCNRKWHGAKSFRIRWVGRTAQILQSRLHSGDYKLHHLAVRTTFIHRKGNRFKRNYNLRTIRPKTKTRCWESPVWLTLIEMNRRFSSRWMPRIKLIATIEMNSITYLRRAVKSAWLPQAKSQGAFPGSSLAMAKPISVEARHRKSALPSSRIFCN